MQIPFILNKKCPKRERIEKQSAGKKELKRIDFANATNFEGKVLSAKM